MLRSSDMQFSRYYHWIVWVSSNTIYAIGGQAINKSLTSW